jgi:hypothetical protein
VTGYETGIVIGTIALLAFYLPMSFWVIRYEKRHQARKKSQD